MDRNKDGQIWIVHAWDVTTNLPATGLNNIVGNLYFNGSGPVPLTNGTFTELADGYYYCTLTAAETNYDNVTLVATTVTANVRVDPEPRTVYPNPANFQAQAIDSLGTIDLGRIMGGALTQSSPGRLSGNFAQFYDNADAQTGKTVDDVGATAGTAPYHNSTDSGTANGSFSSEEGSHTATWARGGARWGGKCNGSGGSPSGSTHNFQVEFNIGDGTENQAVTIESDIALDAGGARQLTILAENKTAPGTWDIVGYQGNTGEKDKDYQTTLFTLQPQNTDANGDCSIRYASVSGQNPLNDGDEFGIDYINLVARGATGAIPSAQEIAIEVDRLQTSTHGDGSWQGSTIHETYVAAVIDASTFTLSSGAEIDGGYAGMILWATNQTTLQLDASLIKTYNSSTREVVLLFPLDFTPVVGDRVKIVVDEPKVVGGYRTENKGSPALLTQEASANIVNFYNNSAVVSSRELDQLSTLSIADIFTGGQALSTTAGALDVVLTCNQTVSNLDMLTNAAVWAYNARTLTSAENITSDGSAILVAAGVVAQVTNVSTVATVTNVTQANVTQWQGRGLGATNMTEDDGTGNDRWTAKALETAPDTSEPPTPAQIWAHSLSEPGGVPLASDEAGNKLSHLLAALRNQIDVTATEKIYYDDNGNAKYKKPWTDDNIKYMETEAEAI